MGFVFRNSRSSPLAPSPIVLFMTFRLSSLPLFVALVLGVVACNDGTTKTSAEQATYVGGTTCASCHANEQSSWENSHHDLAMQEPTSESILGDFNYTKFTYAGVTSTFYQRQDTFFVETDGSDGRLQEFKIDYTFGVTPLQQYLIQFPGGRLQSLGIAWDARPEEDGGQRWFHLYPDETVDYKDQLHWTGPYQNWNFMCAGCHSTNVKKNYILEENRYETTYSDIDVSCEACHGPGSNHAAWARSDKPGAQLESDYPKGLTVSLGDPDSDNWVMNQETGIAKRTSLRKSHTLVETCAPCHSRRSSLDDHFQAGKPLLAHFRPSLLTEGVYYPDGQIQDEVYVYGSFIQSKMYAAGVTCNNCHDPHSLEIRASGNALCSSCHLPARFDTQNHYFHVPGTAAAQCVSCHMPDKIYMGVDSRRDHSFRVPRPDLSVSLETPNACILCHTDQSDSWAAEAVSSWYGEDRTAKSHYGEAIRAGRLRDPDAEPLLVQLAQDSSQPGIARATALSLLGGFPSEVTFQAIEDGLEDADPIVRFASLRALDIADSNTRLRLAYPLLNDTIRTVRVEAARILAPVPAQGLTLTQQKLIDQIVQEYIQAELFNADRPEAHLNLGVLYAGRGLFDDAEASYRAALRIDPANVQAHVNLADLFRLQGREDEGERLLRQMLEVSPDAADGHHALGLLLVRRGSIDEAVEYLAAASNSQPGNERFGYIYGVALNSIGDSSNALLMLERSLGHNPNSRNLLMALATINRDNGSLNAALRYTEDLLALSPQDPSVIQLRAQLQEMIQSQSN